MISIDIVRKIIEENLIVLKDTQKTEVYETKNKAKDFAWETSRIALKDYIANLPYESILDLCALMAYGRDRYLDPNIKCSYQDYIDKRIEYFEGGIHTNQDYAVYLLKKGQKLSEYLNCALELYQNK